MADKPSHGQGSARSAAKALIISLGVKRVAGWCGVTEHAVYQWFHRGTEAEPIPPKHAAGIAGGAFSAGVEIDLWVLLPSLPRSA